MSSFVRYIILVGSQRIHIKVNSHKLRFLFVTSKIVVLKGNLTSHRLLLLLYYYDKKLIYTYNKTV